MDLSLLEIIPQVVFEAIRGSSYTGDIAIDDITYRVGACPVQPGNAVPGTATTTAGPTILTPTPQQGAIDCNFEYNFCGWSQDSTASFNWTRTSGSTGSSNTGPKNDHTLGNSKFESPQEYSVQSIQSEKEMLKDRNCECCKTPTITLFEP